MQHPMMYVSGNGNVSYWSRMEQRANDVLQSIVRGDLKLRIHKTYPLEEAPQAHRDLEGRKTTGKLLLIP